MAKIWPKVTNTKTNRWTYLKEDQWVETDGTNQVLAFTLNGESIDDVLTITLKDPNQAIPGIALEPIKDHLGSILGWTNATNGSLVQKQSFSAYGETTITNPSPLLSQLGAMRGFTSRDLDKDTQIYYYRARYYDPSTGRFLSEDRTRFASGDTNFYKYVRNNPLKYTDPSGNIPILPIIIVGIGLIFPADDPWTITREEGYPILKEPRPTQGDPFNDYLNRKKLENLLENIENEKDLPPGSCEGS